MAIDWQTRGAGRHAHRFHRLTPAQVAAIPTPEREGVQAAEVDGEIVYGLALHTPRLQTRALLWGPVVYPDAETAETHAEAWLTRDRDVFYAERGGDS